jgi:hypothetical protein
LSTGFPIAATDPNLKINTSSPLETLNPSHSLRSSQCSESVSFEPSPSNSTFASPELVSSYYPSFGSPQAQNKATPEQAPPVFSFPKQEIETYMARFDGLKLRGNAQIHAFTATTKELQSYLFNPPPNPAQYPEVLSFLDYKPRLSHSEAELEHFVARDWVSEIKAKKNFIGNIVSDFNDVVTQLKSLFHLQTEIHDNCLDRLRDLSKQIEVLKRIMQQHFERKQKVSSFRGLEAFSPDSYDGTRSRSDPDATPRLSTIHSALQKLYFASSALSSPPSSPGPLNSVPTSPQSLPSAFQTKESFSYEPLATSHPYTDWKWLEAESDLDSLVSLDRLLWTSSLSLPSPSKPSWDISSGQRHPWTC